MLLLGLIHAMWLISFQNPSENPAVCLLNTCTIFFTIGMELGRSVSNRKPTYFSFRPTVHVASQYHIGAACMYQPHILSLDQCSICILLELPCPWCALQSQSIFTEGNKNCSLKLWSDL